LRIGALAIVATIDAPGCRPVLDGDFDGVLEFTHRSIDASRRLRLSTLLRAPDDPPC
jgi:hypothetical protein